YKQFGEENAPPDESCDDRPRCEKENVQKNLNRSSALHGVVRSGAGNGSASSLSGRRKGKRGNTNFSPNDCRSGQTTATGLRRFYYQRVRRDPVTGKYQLRLSTGR